jgi:hypothetical protein
VKTAAVYDVPRAKHEARTLWSSDSLASADDDGAGAGVARVAPEVLFGCHAAGCINDQRDTSLWVREAMAWPTLS